MVEKKPPLIIVAGPTASGKSTLSMKLAQIIGAEIISADSVQVYRKFDIGSAKPDMAMRKEVVHHMIDIVDPEENFTLAKYGRLAMENIDSILQKGHTPLLVGGTGLYIKSLLENLSGGVCVDEASEKEMDRIVKEKGTGELYKMACKIDPERMGIVHENDLYRTRRVLGVYLSSGKNMTSLFREEKQEIRFDPYYILLAPPKPILHERIEARVRDMLANGLREEVLKLADMGYSLKTKAMRSLGYRTVYGELFGEIQKEDCVPMIAQETKAFAKRQMTWFKKIKEAIVIDNVDFDNNDELLDEAVNNKKFRNFCGKHEIKISF